jgi:hypothetical protein
MSRDLKAAEKLPLIGRETYIEEIQTYFSTLEQPAIYYLEGEGGVGKTMLVQEVLKRLGQAKKTSALIADTLVDLYHIEYQAPIGLSQGIIRVLGSPSNFNTYLKKIKSLQERARSGRSSSSEEWKEAWRIFTKALSNLSEKSSILIALDTVEILDYGYDRFQREATDIPLPLADVGQWLINEIFPNLQGPILFVWAGRPTPLHERLQKLKNIKVKSLKPLSQEESLTYLKTAATALRKRDEIGAKRIEVHVEEYPHGLYRGTGGRPILLAMIADILSVGGALPDFFFEESTNHSKEDLTDQDKEKRARKLLEYLMNLQSPVGRTLRALAYLHKGANAELLKRVLEVIEDLPVSKNEAENYLDQISNLTLVKEYGANVTDDSDDVRVEDDKKIYFLHDEIYRLFNRHQSNAKLIWQKVLPKICDYYAKTDNAILEDLRKSPDLKLRTRLEMKRRSLIVEHIHYQLFGTPERGFENYFLRSEDALDGRDRELDMLLRSELLRTKDELQKIGRLENILQRRIETDTAVRWGIRELFLEENPVRAKELFELVRKWTKVNTQEIADSARHIRLYESVAEIRLGNLNKANKSLEALQEEIQEVRGRKSYTRPTQLLEALTNAYLGYLKRLEGNFYQAIDYYHRAIAGFEQLKMGMLVSAYANQIYAMAFVGHFRRSKQILNAALRLVKQEGNPHWEALVRNVGSVAETWANDPLEATIHAQKALLILRTEIQNPRLERLVSVNAARAHRYLWNQSVSKKTWRADWNKALLLSYKLLETGGEIEIRGPLEIEIHPAIYLFREAQDRSTYFIEALNESGCVLREMAWVYRKFNEEHTSLVRRQKLGSWHDDFANAADLAEKRLLEAAGIYDVESSWEEQVRQQIKKLNSDYYHPTLALVNLGWHHRYQYKPSKEVEELCHLIEEIIPSDYKFPKPSRERGETGTQIKVWSVLGKTEMLLFDLALQVDKWQNFSREEKKKRLEKATQYAILSLEYNSLMGEAAFDRHRAEEAIDQRLSILSEEKTLILSSLYDYEEVFSKQYNLPHTELRQWLEERYGGPELWVEF